MHRKSYRTYAANGDNGPWAAVVAALLIALAFAGPWLALALALRGLVSWATGA